MHDTCWQSRISVAEFEAIAAEKLPFVDMLGMQIDSIDADGVTMRARYNPDQLRPGGTIAGPVMMGLADCAVYVLVLSHIGPVELAVTTNLSINFLRKPEPGDLLARAGMLKLGSRLAVAEVSMYSELNQNDVVAHATATYSIPPPAKR